MHTSIDRMGVILRDLVTGEYIVPDDAKPPEVADILEYICLSRCR